MLRSAGLRLAALCFAAAIVVYGGVWMYSVRGESAADLGASLEYERPALRVVRVRPGGAAERGGLRPEDRILAVDGRALTTRGPFFDAVTRGRPGDLVTLTIERAPGTEPLTLPVILELQRREPTASSTAQRALHEIVRLYPLLFILVSLVVLSQRLEDRYAWLLALLFAGFVAGAPLEEAIIHPALRGFALGFRTAFRSLTPALFLYFFSVFPASSPLDARAPWLKRWVLAAAAVVFVPLAVWAFLAGSSDAVDAAAPPWIGSALARWTLLLYIFGALGLGLVSLVGNAIRAPTPEARRKILVIVWGTIVGAAPMVAVLTAAGFQRKELRDLPFWLWAPAVVATFLIPLSFAYAVVKHRVLEIPVLLRRSARYLLVQRGFLILLVLLSAGATALFAQGAAQVLQTRTGWAVAGGAGFGVLLLWAGSQFQRRLTQRLDRAFFRSAYDTRLVLQDLANKVRTANTRAELAELLWKHVAEALHPRDLAIYLHSVGDVLRPEPRSAGLDELRSDLPLLSELARHGRPWVPRQPSVAEDPSLRVLAPWAVECLAPILGRDSRLIGVIVLGLRLSDEPYSREDREMLASVSSQAGMALEVIRLAEDMAARLEAEGRAAREMEIAKDVQRMLYPQRMPKLDTLDYAGVCLQARVVGGDYYDFLDLGQGKIGLVVADISGKGMSAALLMANLQANLRSQYAVALHDLSGLLTSVNRLLYESTDANHFATLFFATYEEPERRLRYVNCGHNPPLLLPVDGEEEWLAATAVVLGVFDTWSCSVGERRLAPGDTLVLYSDGVTEALNEEGEEFGAPRLLEMVRAHRGRPASETLDALVGAVQAFSGSKQTDDITLLVAHAR